MGDELGCATDIGRLLVYSGLSTQFFTLIGNDNFWICHRDFMPKCPQNIGTFWVFLDISAKSRLILKMFGLAGKLLARVSASNFQVLIGSGSRDTTL